MELNENIPNNFIEILSNLSDQYQSRKIGFAIDISDYDLMYQLDNYTGTGMSIYNWEERFWKDKINYSNFELYNAEIDTTFSLLNKKYNELDIRIAGLFTCKHLPWYKDNKLFTIYDNYYFMSINQLNISSFSKHIQKKIIIKFLKIMNSF